MPGVSGGPVFELYAPTRTHDLIELRVRASSSGPLRLGVGDTVHVVERPDDSRAGLHFYRSTFAGLRSATTFTAEASLLSSRQRARLETSTLPAPPGRQKLSIGIMSDLHLSSERCGIDSFGGRPKRLYGLALELGARYIERLDTLGVDLIVFPGDIVDPCTKTTLDELLGLFDRVDTPCYPIIGNHEPWSPGGEELFYRSLDLPKGGYYSVKRKGVRLLMLSTPTPAAVTPGSRQWRWLEAELSEAPASEDVVLFSHFSLLLHPCVQGVNDDGYQLLDDHRALLKLISTYPNVRLFAAGHKNVPSMMLQGGVVHTLSPQLIQAPCGYDVIHLYAEGLARTTYEIDEQHYVEVARTAYGTRYRDRYGAEHDRNFSHRYAHTGI